MRDLLVVVGQFVLRDYALSKVMLPDFAWFAAFLVAGLATLLALQRRGPV